MSCEPQFGQVSKGLIIKSQLKSISFSIIASSLFYVLPYKALPVPVLTREQRSHRRLSWAERLARNALAETGIHWQVQLFGIASTVLEWLHSLHPRPVLIS
ncbi:MAG: hypothetical protein J0L70_31775, partial [Leptolyngbya sp. UWPOB_LEPTO1]|uniref:hypothetical protein n=1 Tax=Leptolyngbya sp. UWPOB_LEPTO1 TaxID=2815653 RepID=UPI001ACEF39F